MFMYKCYKCISREPKTISRKIKPTLEILQTLVSLLFFVTFSLSHSTSTRRLYDVTDVV